MLQRPSNGQGNGGHREKVDPGQLQGVMDEMAPAPRALVELSMRERLPPDEIAVAVGTDPGTIQEHVDDALVDIADRLSNGHAVAPAAVASALRALPPAQWRPGDPALREALGGHEAPGERRRVRFTRTRGLELGLLAAVPALVALRGPWAVDFMALLLLLVVPGLIALRAIRVPRAAIERMPIYVPCASLFVLMAAGLTIDLLGPSFGLDTPLRPLPLAAAVVLVCLALFGAGLRAGRECDLRWESAAVRLRSAWPVVLPVAAAVGALRLNAGHSPAFAAGALIAVAATVLVVGIRAQRYGWGALRMVLYAIGLAAAWSFSLRGHYVYGFDINTELRILEDTTSHGIWSTAHPNDAYGAMLSLTVLPAMLHELTGVAPLVLLKAVYPALFALFPVALFSIAGRVLPRQYAFLAASFVAVQSYFFQQMPGIARQEIALVLFVALVACFFDNRLPRRSQWWLVSMLAVAVAVTHYSTTYVVIVAFAIAFVLQFVVGRFDRAARSLGKPVLIGFVFALGAASFWYGPITESGSNLTKFTNDIREKGFNLLPSASKGENPVLAYFSGNTVRNVPATEYQAVVAREYARTRQFVNPIPAAKQPRYALRDATAPVHPVRFEPGRAATVFGSTAVAQIGNILAILGALLLVVSRRSPPVGRHIGIVALSMLVAVGVLRLSGTAATAYNQERAFVQTMVPLAVALAWTLRLVSVRAAFLKRTVPALSFIALALLFFNTSGLRGYVFGGDTPTNLAADGEDYERFYSTAPELAAASWLGTAAPVTAVKYTDRYGQLRVAATSGDTRNLLLDPTPLTLDRGAWVYGSQTNVVDGRARGQTGNVRSTYAWPSAFLADQFATVYSNGYSRVYHR